MQVGIQLSFSQCFCPRARGLFEGSLRSRLLQVFRAMVVKCRVATDCSGTDAPLYALEACSLVRGGRLRIAHRWSSDNNETARQFIMANHAPETLLSDMVSRAHSELRKLDLYFVGFPCQAFSALGRQRGLKDPRAKTYRAVIATLRECRIRAFVLENVANLVGHDKGRALRKILRDLETAGPGYKVVWRVYRSSDFGLPQRRSRIYSSTPRSPQSPPLPLPPSLRCGCPLWVANGYCHSRKHCVYQITFI